MVVFVDTIEVEDDRIFFFAKFQWSELIVQAIRMVLVVVGIIEDQVGVRFIDYLAERVELFGVLSAPITYHTERFVCA